MGTNHNMFKSSVALIMFGLFAAALARGTSRVLGGDTAALGEFPYQASIQVHGPGAVGHFCGAAIIADNAVVTAATCVINPPLLDHLMVVAGMVNIHSEQTQGSRIARTLVHPDFKPDVPGPNDIAVHILTNPFQFDDYVQPIALPEPGSVPSGAAVLTGWGSKDDSDPPTKAEDLQKATLSVLSNEECLAAWGAESPLADTNLCTDPLTGGQGACSGDTGSPLAQDNTLLGIVTWGHLPCGDPGFPSVYTRVSAFMDFISDSLALAKSLRH